MFFTTYYTLILPCEPFGMPMKKHILFVCLLCFSFYTRAQDFSGQWKGEFTDKSTAFGGFGGEKCDYVLELECKGKNVTGSSYTYFTDGGKRYYTICKLEGFVDPKSKYIEVREIERTKTNVPITIRNCFQIHKLTYFKKGDSTILKGDWDPAPNQQGGCGYGVTFLARRELKQSFPSFNGLASKSLTDKKTTVEKKTIATPKPHYNPNPFAGGSKKAPVIAKTEAKKPANKNTSPVKPAQELTNNQTATTLDKEPAAVPEVENPEPVVDPKIKFEKRNSNVIKTINVDNRTVRIDLYDNGEIDGDSISLFYNDKLLLSGKRLSEKPITLNITVEDGDVNELKMYAENLGSIPPNTALMVVTDGHKRYEVRITSDLQKSGVINFVHKSGS